jgi:energy-coupling factor transporter ATP-binding protein EcfA2
MGVQIIGLVGLIGSGKTTAANLLKGLVATKSIRVELLAFSDPLKATLETLFFLTSEQLNDTKEKEKPIAELNGHSPRSLMQTFGTAIMREAWPSVLESKQLPNVMPKLPLQQKMTFWVWHMKRRIERLQQQHADEDNLFIIIHDVRYPDEMEMLSKSFQAKFIHLERTTATALPSSATAHSSENFSEFLKRPCHLKIRHTNFEPENFVEPITKFFFTEYE